MSEGERKPPAFFCPHCGQKHRADLTPLEKRPGASVTIRCRRCEKGLSIRLEDGKPVCEEAVESAPNPPPTNATPTPTPTTPKPKAVTDPVTTPPTLPAPPTHTPYDAALSDKPLTAGQQAGRYTVKSEVRKGLTSTVYRAHDPTTKRSVGLKVLGAKAPSEVRERFLRQVDVQAKIRHPSILPVYDRGELEDGRPFMAMELLHHPLTLGEVLDRRAAGTLENQKKLAPLADLGELVERVLVPVADGIYVANIESGVVHADLRPENILVDGHTLRPYVADFGRASSVKGEDAGDVVAMPSTQYLSPEQARGNIHSRTDVWGLGALLHALITGMPPLAGSGDALRREAADGTYAPLPDDAPPALQAVVRKAMAPEPQDRYVNARQLTADLKAWRHGGRVRAIDEFGGPGISVEEKRKALRVRLRAVGWIAAGLMVGLLIGSQIQLGGEDPHEIRMRAIASRVERLHQDVSELGEKLISAPGDLGYTPYLAALSPEDAYRIWRDLDHRAEALLRSLATTESSATRLSLEARVEYVRGRLVPAPVPIDAPAGTTVEALNVATGDRVQLSTDLARIPPGYWTVSVGASNRARIPVCVPLSVRPQGVDADAMGARAAWKIPVPPESLPASRVMVVGCTVSSSRLPFGQTAEPTDVATFAMDRKPITYAQYALFLAALPEEEREPHAPSEGLELSRARIWRPASGMGRLPVEGIRPADATAYCVWASAEEGVTLRLPTEAEWLVAQGAACATWTRGDLATKNEAPYGVIVLPEDVGELVAATPPAAGPLLKRAGAWYASTPAPDARTLGVQFRCVQVLEPRTSD